LFFVWGSWGGSKGGFVLKYWVLKGRGGGVNCLRGIFANFEGIMKFNVEVQRKESRKQIPKTVLR